MNVSGKREIVYICYKFCQTPNHSSYIPTTNNKQFNYTRLKLECSSKFLKFHLWLSKSWLNMTPTRRKVIKARMIKWWRWCILSLDMIGWFYFSVFAVIVVGTISNHLLGILFMKLLFLMMISFGFFLSDSIAWLTTDRHDT